MARITNGSFAGSAGELEYILYEDAAPPGAPLPQTAAVICHPHPLFGGTMHTRIVFQTAQVLAEHNLPTLRFNFRGVGRSQGRHDYGRGEQEDIRAAITFLRRRYPVPLLLGGFSFGATTVTTLLASGAPPEIKRVLLMGLPLDRAPIPVHWRWQGPKLLISGDRDEFASLSSLESYYAALPEPKAREWIHDGDHFMTGHKEAFRAALARHVRSQTG